MYGAGAVYPAISFNNVAATITNLVIKDGTGATVFDSAAGGILVTYIPASLTLSSSALAITKGASGAGDRDRDRRRGHGLDGDRDADGYDDRQRHRSPTARPTRPSRSPGSRAARPT